MQISKAIGATSLCDYGLAVLKVRAEHIDDLLIF